jgi:hypothetical protein
MSAGESGRRSLLVPHGESNDPKLRAVSTADCALMAVVPGDRTVSISVSIAPGPPPSGWQYVAAFIRGRLSPATTVVDLRGLAGTSVSGIGKSTFSCYVGGLDGDALPSTPLVVHAVVPAEEVTREVELTIRADFSLTRPRFPLLPGRRLDHGRVNTPWTFPLTLPGLVQSGEPVHSHDAATLTGVRLCVAADIESYSRFLDPEAAQAQERFVEVLRAARAHAGIDESAVSIQQSGDGQYAMLPACIDETAVIPKLLEGFEIGLRAANKGRGDGDRLRIRLALDRGIVTPSVNGYVGRSTITVHRLLDSQILREALAERTRFDHALIVSETIYQEVVRHGYGGIKPAEFAETVVHVPQKNFSERAWLHSPPR